MEVDFVLGGGDVAIEVKGTNRVDPRDSRPLLAFVEQYRPKKALVICNEPAERIHGPVRILPWRRFLEELWSDRIVS
jgi:predicted AAA+ superfamily ATPase